jgi:hypothetical protein
MSIREEALAADQSYAESFGDKGGLTLPPAPGSTISDNAQSVVDGAAAVGAA